MGLNLMVMIKRVFWIALLFVLSLSAYGRVTVEAAEEIINETTQITAGTFSSFRLQLDEGDVLHAKFNVSGGANNKVRVWLVDLSNYQKFKIRQRFSYLKGTGGEIQNEASYAIQVPETDVYYLVLDNLNAWMAKRNVTVEVIRVSPYESEREKVLREGIEKFYSRISTMFKFDDFDISVKLCGYANAFSDPDITMCWEMLNSLINQKKSEALHFIMFHEIAHSLMNIWHYPLYDNEDVADELATVMLIMDGRESAALEAAAWWAEQDATKMAMQKLRIDDRHTVSIQRARNIINWLHNKEKLMNRWLTLLAPNMRRELLQSIVDGKLPYKFREEDIESALQYY